MKQPIYYLATLLSFLVFNCSAYTVTNLTAVYHNGQVFLTWNNPSATNLQYNVYRSASQFTSSSQLTSSKFMGFVRDSSSKNIRMSLESSQQIFFRITNGGSPLTGSQGLYVVTCTDNQSYFYAVTVTKLSNSTEDKT